MKIVAGMNGFGRFGLHLIKYYLDRYTASNFQIKYINDDFLSLEDAYKIITTDRYVKFNKYKILIEKESNSLVVKTPEGVIHKFIYSLLKSKRIFGIPQAMYQLFDTV